MTASSRLVANRAPRARHSPSPRSIRGEGRDEGRELARRLRMPPPLTLALSPHAGRGDVSANLDTSRFARVVDAEGMR